VTEWVDPLPPALTLEELDQILITPAAREAVGLPPRARRTFTGQPTGKPKRVELEDDYGFDYPDDEAKTLLATLPPSEKQLLDSAPRDKRLDALDDSLDQAPTHLP
jgi:hypothetical protein